MRTALALLTLTVLSACGPTVGDACTTAAECGNNTACINRDYAPGGYCSQVCTIGAPNTCPGGTICVRDGVAKNTPGCMRTCRDVKECRPGYVCQFAKDSAQTVCIGAAGI